ncbi:unnamed protein product, partial [Amoebophrya sp. A25]|eukprot:GSA25T00005953001.1
MTSSTCPHDQRPMTLPQVQAAARSFVAETDGASSDDDDDTASAVCVDIYDRPSNELRALLEQSDLEDDLRRQIEFELQERQHGEALESALLGGAGSPPGPCRRLSRTLTTRTDSTTKGNVVVNEVGAENIPILAAETSNIHLHDAGSTSGQQPLSYIDATALPNNNNARSVLHPASETKSRGKDSEVAGSHVEPLPPIASDPRTPNSGSPTKQPGGDQSRSRGAPPKAPFKPTPVASGDFFISSSSVPKSKSAVSSRRAPDLAARPAWGASRVAPHSAGGCSSRRGGGSDQQTGSTRGACGSSASSSAGGNSGSSATAASAGASGAQASATRLPPATRSRPRAKTSASIVRPSANSGRPSSASNRHGSAGAKAASSGGRSSAGRTSTPGPSASGTTSTRQIAPGSAGKSGGPICISGSGSSKLNRVPSLTRTSSQRAPGSAGDASSGGLGSKIKPSALAASSLRVDQSANTIELEETSSTKKISTPSKNNAGSAAECVGKVRIRPSSKTGADGSEAAGGDEESTTAEESTKSENVDSSEVEDHVEQVHALVVKEEQQSVPDEVPEELSGFLQDEDSDAEAHNYEEIVEECIDPGPTPRGSSKEASGAPLNEEVSGAAEAPDDAGVIEVILHDDVLPSFFPDICSSAPAAPKGQDGVQEIPIIREDEIESQRAAEKQSARSDADNTSPVKDGKSSTQASADALEPLQAADESGAGVIRDDPAHNVTSDDHDALLRKYSSSSFEPPGAIDTDVGTWQDRPRESPRSRRARIAALLEAEKQLQHAGSCDDKVLQRALNGNGSSSELQTNDSPTIPGSKVLQNSVSIPSDVNTSSSSAGTSSSPAASSSAAALLRPVASPPPRGSRSISEDGGPGSGSRLSSSKKEHLQHAREVAAATGASGGASRSSSGGAGGSSSSSSSTRVGGAPGGSGSFSGTAGSRGTNRPGTQHRLDAMDLSPEQVAAATSSDIAKRYC